MWRVIKVGITSLVPLTACLFAALSGGFFGFHWFRRKSESLYRKRVRERYLDQGYHQTSRARLSNKKIPESILKFIQEQNNIIRLKPHNFYFTKGFWLMGGIKLKELSSKAGFESNVSLLGLCHARALLCLGGSISCALIGVVFSLELALMGMVLGAIMGWRMPRWACKLQVESRKKDIEDHLSEMLEVVSLGLRSGLSFDQSFELYHRHFQTNLGVHAASIQRQWQLGLSTREEALLSFARAYDSSLFSRVIQNIIRSLRFGASLAESFDSAALEARLIHKAHREEEVAKAPVKMLVPTAALILPAMLLLVLGPVLLEMMQGF